jgi:hypothetical protein
VLLTLSCRGISLSDLVEHVNWLQGEIMCRGGLVAPIQDSARAVGNALRSLERHVQLPQKGETLEPLLRPRQMLENRQELASYRNQCVHLFVQEVEILKTSFCESLSLQIQRKADLSEFRAGTRHLRARFAA